MKKYFLLFLSLSLLFSGCKNNNSKKDLIKVLEENGFDCADDYCEKKDNFNDSKTVFSVDFKSKQYVVEMKFEEGSIKTYYNWKIGNVEQYIDYLGENNEEVSIYGNIDNDGKFSCSVDIDECNQIKTTSIQVKNDFLDYISLADIELEDI